MLAAKKILFSTFVVIVSMLVSLLVIDVSVLIIKSTKIPFLKTGRAWNRLDSKNPYIKVDDDLGYMPMLEQGAYSRYGAKVNNYSLEKNPDFKRILFIGDSVTEEGLIIENLKKLYGEESYEYWNAGVRGFNTHQELIFYRRYNKQIRPDQVILTFHLNDFTTTPVVFLNKEDRLVFFCTVC